MIVLGASFSRVFFIILSMKTGINIIWNLMYDMVATYADIAYVVALASKYMTNLEHKHVEAIKHKLC